MSDEKFEQIKIDLAQSLEFLNGALAQEKNAYMIAAVIQAFEICVELSWKYMQSKLITADGIVSNSPKSSIREFAAAGYDINPVLWIEFADLRNLSVHTYRPLLAEEMYAKIKNEFPSLVAKILQ